MTTDDRIQLLADACALPCVENLLGKVTACDLSAWIAAELGKVSALDAFRPHGPLHSKAIAPGNILHIVSGNTPHAAIQSIIRGLLLGSHNIIKLPSTGLSGLTGCIDRFPVDLQTLIETHDSLTDELLAKSDAIIAIGSDASIEAIHQRTLPHQIFIPHGHKVSMGIVYGDFENAARLAARDVSLYNQQGCLSLHAVYVHGDSLAFSGLLAGEMEKFTVENPQHGLSLSEAGAIRNLRETTRFRAANDPTTGLYESQQSLDWTVIHEPSPALTLSCLNRCVYVKPLPEKINPDTLGPESRHLSTIAIHPFGQDRAASLTHLPAHRICPLGQSQQPSLFWHHDGFAPLASLVKWKDLG
ncbi:MAG: hypothetical protein H7A51_05550 [Akkermansiaceae bacterium]|nr:hypothetical protein [Akkermansiaceae bacterium]